MENAKKMHSLLYKLAMSGEILGPSEIIAVNSELALEAKGLLAEIQVVSRPIPTSDIDPRSTNQ